MLKLSFSEKDHFYELVVGLLCVALITIGCMVVMAPFLTAIFLASVFALSGWPAYEWTRSKLHLGPRTSALLVTVVLAIIFIMPLVIIGTSASENFAYLLGLLQNSMKSGDLSQLSPWLERLPWIGNELADYWNGLIHDTERMQQLLQSTAKPVSQGLLTLGGTIGKGLVQMALAIFIAYFFFRHGMHVALRLRNLSEKYGGNRGRELLEVTKKTLIGVVYGILGTALAQGTLAALGFWMAGVPGASLLGLLVCFLSLVPIGPPLIWGPAAYWLHTQGQDSWAVFMVVWGVVAVSGVDNILKPYFISLGSNLPFVLVLFGIGGGALAFGFIGIFIGPTLLALAYSLILELSTSRPLVKTDDTPAADDDAGGPIKLA